MNEYYRTREGKRLLLHAGKDATDRAFAYFGEDTIVISDSTGKNSIQVADSFGTSIAGPISILANPEQIRVAGLWKINPLVISSLPSTVYTPIPWLKQSIPTSAKAIIDGIAGIAEILA